MTVLPHTGFHMDTEDSKPATSISFYFVLFFKIFSVSIVKPKRKLLPLDRHNTLTSTQNQASKLVQLVKVLALQAWVWSSELRSAWTLICNTRWGTETQTNHQKTHGPTSLEAAASEKQQRSCINKEKTNSWKLSSDLPMCIYSFPHSTEMEAKQPRHMLWGVADWDELWFTLITVLIQESRLSVSFILSLKIFRFKNIGN